jgi:predicted dehydrogenase
VSERTRYAIVGLGKRSRLFTTAILGDYADRAELVALCDVNRRRMAYANECFTEKFDVPAVPTYTPDRFEGMIRETQADRLIVTSIDRTHHRYIIDAMEMGLDVITEKPMTIDAPRCQAILDCIKRTGRELRVALNYRYAPRNAQVKELLAAGTIGQVLSVHFEWLLDTSHGADYFRRWHRDKRNSGGLMVHKATHHLDLANWWTDSTPATVFGLGGLRFYGRENAEARGAQKFYDRAHGRSNAVGDPFALNLDASEELRRMYLEAEDDDGYIRDQSVFGDNISIEDDMSVAVRFASGATMTYHLTAYSPWEGYRVNLNGTEGRLEFSVEESSYVSGSETDPHRADRRDTPEAPAREHVRLCVRPHWRPPYDVAIESGGEGGHAGGDARMLASIFGEFTSPDPLGRAATHIDGAYAMLAGAAANLSFATGQPVHIRDLVTL